MHITILLFGTLRDKRFPRRVQYCAEGASIREIIAELGIPPNQIGIILLNDIHVQPETTLSEHDTLKLYPLVGGG